MSALLEKIAAAEQARESAASEAYRDLMQQLANGTEDPSLTDVQAVLAAAGKSAGELAADVSTVTHRNELRDKIAAAEAGAIEKRGLLEQIEAAAAKLEAAKRAHDETVLPLQLRISEIDHMAMEAAAAKRELLTSCDDEDLLQREQSNRSALAHVDKLIGEQRQLVSRVKANLDRLIQADGEDAPATRQKREKWEAESAKLDALRAEQTELVEQSNAIVEEKINA